jgi:uncharacterized protein (DUF2164 family)
MDIKTHLDRTYKYLQGVNRDQKWIMEKLALLSQRVCDLEDKERKDGTRPTEQ